jgi:adenine deaminase
VANQVNSEAFHDAIPQSDWIKMITVNPARALALDGQIGALKQGLKADITVVRSNDGDPTQSLLKTYLQDVQMVWVGGKLLYGSESILQKLKKDACEALLVRGSKKRVCVSDPKPSFRPPTQASLPSSPDPTRGTERDHPFTSGEV